MPLPPPEAPPQAGALRPARLIVDLDALRANFALLAARVRPAACLAVVKADAYGHGAVEVSQTLAAEGIGWLAVAMVEEGAELRRAGVRTPILVFGAVSREQVPLVRKFDLVPAIPNLGQLALWCEAAPGPGRLDVHLKIDTGMTRLGIAPPELGEALARLAATPRLRLTGLMSHLAEADEPESPRNAEQERLFADLLASLPEESRRGVKTHLANSAAALHRPPGPHDLVRLGLSLYGVDPARRERGLTPVLSASAEIVHVREVPPGTRGGYGGRWQAARPSRVGVVPVGYADGYPWRLGNRAEALVDGRRVPVAGSVSMDMMLIDLTGTGAGVGDEAVLIGRQGSEQIAVQELADRAGTIPYEILCGLRQRLPRAYLSGGRWKGLRSRLMAGGEG